MISYQMLEKGYSIAFPMNTLPMYLYIYIGKVFIFDFNIINTHMYVSINNIEILYLQWSYLTTNIT